MRNHFYLFNLYVTSFIRKGILAGLKGYLSPVYETEAWIIHARYLLTQITDSELDTMFEKHENQRLLGYYDSHESFCMAATWMAALLKKEQYIPHIGALALKGGNTFQTAVYYAALHLYDTHSLCNYYLAYLNSEEKESPSFGSESKTLAKYSLELYDRKHQTNYAAPFTHIEVSIKEQNLINTILKYSDILRANINFITINQFKHDLLELTQQTTSPIYYCQNLLTLPKYSHLESYFVRYRDDFEMYQKEILLKYTESKKTKKTFKIEKDKQSDKKSFVNFDVTNHAKLFFKDCTNLKITNELIICIGNCSNPSDLLCTLECDIHYVLPHSVIISLFNRLFELINSSYFLYELYAIHLLIRGTEYDAKAKELYAKATNIKNTIIWIKDEAFNYVIKKN
jgi:hypothetical protein